MVGIKHHTQTAKPDDPAYDVSKDEWNEAHDAGATADVLTDHDKVLHDALGITAADHAADHEVGGGDLVSHDTLTDFVAAEHLSLPNTIANVLTDHDKAAHDALNIDADTFDGLDSTSFASASHGHQCTKTVGFTAICDYICDGVADNVQIQAALTAVGALGGGSVILQRGTYNLDAIVSFANHYCRLAGQGIGATVLRATSVLTHMVTLNWSVCCFEDLSFESNAKATDGIRVATGGSGGSLIWFNRVYFMAFTAGCGVNCVGSSCGYFYVTYSYGYTNKYTFYLRGANHIVSGTLFGADQTSVYSVGGTYDVVVTNCIFIANSGSNYAVDLNGAELSVTNNIFYNASQGIRLTPSQGAIVSGNAIVGRGGINVVGTATFVSIANNLLITTQDYLPNNAAIYVSAISQLTVASNAISFLGITAANKYGIYLTSCLYATCSSNVAYGAVYSGSEGIRLNACTSIQVLGNVLRTWATGIDIVAGATNKVKDNRMVSCTTCFADTGTDTAIHSILVPFVNGTDPQDSGFLVNSTNGGDDFARTYTMLPVEVQQVVRTKVYARSAILEVHAMEADFTIYGAADNEPYTTHNGSAASLASTSTNFAADDVIYWSLTNAGILALLRKDSVQVKVDYAAVDVDNCATNAYFRTVEIEYV